MEEFYSCAKPKIRNKVYKFDPLCLLSCLFTYISASQRQIFTLMGNRRYAVSLCNKFRETMTMQKLRNLPSKRNPIFHRIDDHDHYIRDHICYPNPDKWHTSAQEEKTATDNIAETASQARFVFFLALSTDKLQSSIPSPASRGYNLITILLGEEGPHRFRPSFSRRGRRPLHGRRRLHPRLLPSRARLKLRSLPPL